MIESLLLVLSICIDAFVASIAYGTNKIKIPFISVIIISLVGSVILGVSLFLGGFILEFLPGKIPIILSFCILMLIGIYRLFEGLFKNYIQKRAKSDKPFTVVITGMKIVLQIYADETKADFDNSKTLAPKEAFYLALALSFDSLAVGFGSSLAGGNYLMATILCLIVGIAAILLGGFIGKKIVQKSNINLSWLSGLILMILAFIKLL